MRARVLAAVVLGLVGCPPPPEPPPPPPPPDPVVVVPPPPPASPTAIIDIATFHEHHCVLRRAGNLACWGKNTYGQLGNGVRDDNPELVDAKGIDDATQLAVGRDFSCALRKSGTVACWGNNEDGQLGDGAGVAPGALNLGVVEVKGVSAETLSAGEYHICALDDGTVHCWGNGANGQIGSADARAFGTAQRIALSGVKQIASGASHVCALLRGGEVWCWGRNTEGQLGADVSGSRPKPVRVKGIDDATFIASGHNHSCALLGNSSMSCWGDNSGKQLGPGAGNDARRKIPVTVPDIDDAAQIAAGDRHTCVRRKDGGVLCWGDNSRGQLSGSEGPAQADAVEVTDMRDAIQLSLGLAQSCAVHRDGHASCWGAATKRID